MKKITVAFGAHDQATSSLRWAAEVAHATETPLEVVNVLEPTYAEINPPWFQELLDDRRAQIESVVSDYDGLTHEVVVLHGTDPYEQLRQFVSSTPGSLVVIGAHDTHAAGGFGAGRPAHALLHHVHEPVAMIHPGYEPLSGGVIVVGVDGSGPNAVALEWAEQFAAAIGSTLHAVFAYNPMDDTFTHAEGWHRHSDEVRTIVDKVGSVPIKLYMAAGHPSEVLLEHAQRERAAAIVVGTRGRGGFDGLVLGRVPAQLIAHATCPLIVVPH